MKITELKVNTNPAYLYEGLESADRKSMMLWESAGRAIAEAQMSTADITKLFQQIEQGETATGGNRTAVGSAKDAWTDLKSKIYNSAPMANFASAYEQAAEKLKQATGGDQGVMQYVQKYRDFAKKHPIIQGFVYSALIGAAGISGAGLGGAAALALLKTADKALQGDDIRSALWSGAKTGAMAYGASKLGDYLRGNKQSPDTPNTVGDIDPDTEELVRQAKELTQDWNPTKYDYVSDGKFEVNIFDKATGEFVGTYPVDMGTANEIIEKTKTLAGAAKSAATDVVTNVAGNVNSMTVSKGAYKIFADKVANGAVTDHNSYVKALQDSLTQAGGEQLKAQSYQAAQMSLENAIKGTAARAAGGEFSGSNTDWVAQTIKAFGGKVNPAAIAKDTATINSLNNFESHTVTAAQVTALFEHIVISEGLWDSFKGAAGQAVGSVVKKVQTVGHNITTKVTADKLQKAWQAAGSPTDSEAIVDIILGQGISQDVVNNAVKAVGIKAVDRTKLPDIKALDLDQKQELLKQLDAMDATEAKKKPAAKSQPKAKPAMAEYAEFKRKLQAAKA